MTKRKGRKRRTCFVTEARRGEQMLMNVEIHMQTLFWQKQEVTGLGTAMWTGPAAECRWRQRPHSASNRSVDGCSYWSVVTADSSFGLELANSLHTRASFMKTKKKAHVATIEHKHTIKIASKTSNADHIQCEFSHSFNLMTNEIAVHLLADADAKHILPAATTRL